MRNCGCNRNNRRPCRPEGGSGVGPGSGNRPCRPGVGPGSGNRPCRPGVGPGSGNRPGRPGPCCGNRPGKSSQGASPGYGFRPDRCDHDDVAGDPCPYKTPRAWQNSRYN